MALGEPVVEAPAGRRVRRAGGPTGALGRAVAVTALLVPVAAAVGGERASAGQVALDAGATVALVWLVAGSAAVVWLFVAAKARPGGTRPPPPPWRRVLRSVAPLLVVIAALLLVDRSNDDPVDEVAPPPTAPQDDGGEEAAEDDTSPRWGLVLPAVALVLAGGAVLAVRGVRRLAAGDDEETEGGLDDEPPDTDDALARLADASVEALEDETDPRRAVIAAYAAMDRLLGELGLARLAWETPREHLARALDALGAAGPVAGILVDRFESARYSTAPVTEGDRQVALEQLRLLRRDVTRARTVGSARIVP